MKMPYYVKMIPVMVLGLLLLPGSVCADSHHPGAGRHQGMSKGEQGVKGHGRHHGMHGSHLFGPSWKQTLTEDQIRKIDQMHADFAKVKALLRAKMTLAKIELALLTTEEAPDTGAIDEKIRELIDLKGRLLREHSAHVVEVRKALTPEQRASFDMHVLKKAKRQHRKAH